MEERDFKGVWIPKDIWSLDLPLTDKLYLAIYRESGKNVKIADNIMLINISASSLLKIKTRLSIKGYLQSIKTPEEARKFVIDVKDSGQICEWCGRKNYILHEHHYPIPKSKGGIETVKICPNCHTTYHFILKENFNNED